MKKIKRRTFYQTRQKADGSEYVLYQYEIEDDLGNLDKIDTLQEFEKGELVRVWFDSKYNKQKLGKLCQKCLGPAKSLPSPEHEFCHIKHY